MLRLLRLLRVFMVMQRTGEKKKKMNKKGGGVSFSSPSERVPSRAVIGLLDFPFLVLCFSKA